VRGKDWNGLVRLGCHVSNAAHERRRWAWRISFFSDCPRSVALGLGFGTSFGLGHTLLWAPEAIHMAGSTHFLRRVFLSVLT